MCGTTWGANERILKKVYQQNIRPHLEYGSSAWCAAKDTTLQKLDNVQNQALRCITGALKSTPVVAMKKITELQPLQERRDTKIIIQGEKYHSIPNHPLKERFTDLAMGRLKRSSFIHQAKKLRRQYDNLPDVSVPLSSVPEQMP